MRAIVLIAAALAIGCTSSETASRATPAASPTPPKAKTVEIASVRFTFPEDWTYANGVARPPVPPATKCELRFGAPETASKPDPWFDGAWRSLLIAYETEHEVPRVASSRPTYELKTVGATLIAKDGTHVDLFFLALINVASSRALPLAFVCTDHAAFEAHRDAARTIAETATWLEGDVPLTETPLASGGWKSLSGLGAVKDPG